MKQIALSEFASIQQGYTFKHEYQGSDSGKWMYVKVGDLNSHGNIKYVAKTKNYINDDVLAKMKAKPFMAGSIVFPRVGEALRSNNKRILTQSCLTDDNVLVITVSDTTECYAEFLYYWFESQDLQKFCNDGSVPVISGKNLKKQIVSLPSLPEQTAIVSLLSTWDLAIDKTERLITAKENGFTALTQKLIHNCTGELRHFHLRDVCEPVTRKNSVNELNVLTTSAQHGLVSQLDYYKKSVSAEDVRGYYLLKNGEFAYNRSSSNGYPYGAIKRLEDYPQGVLSTLYLCFSIKDDAPCDSDFMAHAFEAGLLNRQLAEVCQEGARSHGLLNITKTDFFGLKISLPPLAEQQKVAAILNTARQEIDLLKRQADALRRQKRGLMQKLLTGEWRVRVG